MIYQLHNSNEARTVSLLFFPSQKPIKKGSLSYSVFPSSQTFYNTENTYLTGNRHVIPGIYFWHINEQNGQISTQNVCFNALSNQPSPVSSMVSLFKTKLTVLNQLELSMIWIYSYSTEQLLLMDYSQENMSIFQLPSLGNLPKMNQA